LRTHAALNKELTKNPSLSYRRIKVEIPTTVLSSVETLDELQDWLAAQNPEVIAELHAACQEDQAGQFKTWKPRHLACPPKAA
jgi:hypothetical protein